MSLEYQFRAKQQIQDLHNVSYEKTTTSFYELTPIDNLVFSA